MDIHEIRNGICFILFALAAYDGDTALSAAEREKLKKSIKLELWNLRCALEVASNIPRRARLHDEITDAWGMTRDAFDKVNGVLGLDLFLAGTAIIAKISRKHRQAAFQQWNAGTRWQWLTE